MKHQQPPGRWFSGSPTVEKWIVFTTNTAILYLFFHILITSNIARSLFFFIYRFVINFIWFRATPSYFFFFFTIIDHMKHTNNYFNIFYRHNWFCSCVIILCMPRAGVWLTAHPLLWNDWYFFYRLPRTSQIQEEIDEK